MTLTIDNEALKTQLKSLQLKRNGALEKLFGHQLLTKSGLLSTSEACKSKKRVAIYFSAHWCPPCKQFTPLLAEMYQDAKRIGEHELEVIFCSSDHDSASFRSYFQSMPWIAVPFEEERTRSSLSSFYSIQGIPALIVLDSFGNVIDANARNAVATSGGSAADCLRQWSR